MSKRCATIAQLLGLSLAPFVSIFRVYGAEGLAEKLGRNPIMAPYLVEARHTWEQARPAP